MYDIGIIGGMGPQACSYLFDFIVKNTIAGKDQDHPSIVVLNDTKIPDRSDYILGISKSNPTIQINKDIDFLKNAQVSVVGIACNTSHFFYDDLNKYSDMKILNMPEITLRYCQKRNLSKLVILSTLGTIRSKIYEQNQYCKASIIYPNNEEANAIHKMIYDMKHSPTSNLDTFASQTDSIITSIINAKFEKKDSVAIVLGCTELSILTPYLRRNTNFEIIDSLELLAYSLIKESGYQYKTNNYYDFQIIGEINGPRK